VVVGQVVRDRQALGEGLGMAGGRRRHRADLGVRIGAQRLRVDGGDELRADDADADWAHGHSSVLGVMATVAAPRTPARFPSEAGATVIRRGGAIAARATAAAAAAANISQCSSIMPPPRMSRSGSSACTIVQVAPPT